MDNAPQTAIATEKLKKKFGPQEESFAKAQKHIDELESQLKNEASQLSSVEKQQLQREIRSKKRTRSRELQDFREELRFARDAALDEVQKEIFGAIAKVRQSKDIDIIIQEYVSASERVNITSDVMAFLKNKIASEPSAQ